MVVGMKISIIIPNSHLKLLLLSIVSKFVKFPQIVLKGKVLWQRWGLDVYHFSKSNTKIRPRVVSQSPDLLIFVFLS